MRRQKDEFFRNSPDSPLCPDQRLLFAGLRYFPYNSALDLRVEVRPFPNQADIELQTTSGETRWFRRYGEFSFDVTGNTARLTIFQTTEGFFLPFVDGGAGVATYIGGRYLEPVALTANMFRVDFNLAYNPFCAYSEGWSCPITPPENRFGVLIEAGEKSSPTG